MIPVHKSAKEMAHSFTKKKLAYRQTGKRRGDEKSHRPHPDKRHSPPQQLSRPPPRENAQEEEEQSNLHQGGLDEVE